MPYAIISKPKKLIITIVKNVKKYVLSYLKFRSNVFNVDHTCRHLRQLSNDFLVDPKSVQIIYVVEL